MIKAENETRPRVPPALGQHIDKYGCPDGLFCYNDDMAIAASRALYEMGLRVPDDVAIVGCNGTLETDYTTPRLSTIVQPIERMCAIAATFLKQRIADPSLPLQQIALQPHLEIRASSQRLPKT
jgi:DNA-binding LacI/PurR family transcriptional regulator